MTNPIAAVLKIGAVVRLPSGSPDMMVVDFDGESVTTAWRDVEGNVHEYRFNPVCLIPACPRS